MRVELEGELFAVVKFLDFGPRPAKALAFVPGNPLDAEMRMVEEGFERPIRRIGLPADPESEVVGEVRLGETVAERWQEFRVAVGGDLDEDHVRGYLFTKCCVPPFRLAQSVVSVENFVDRVP